MTKQISFTLNENFFERTVDVRLSLLEMLREEMQLTGTKKGCGVGECGACTVIIDGETVDSCLYLAVWANGREIKTIEGITNNDGSLTDVQQALVDFGAVQCGFCTPGFVVSATALLNEGKKITKDEVKRGLSGNLCRCTGYSKIIDAAFHIINK